MPATKKKTRGVMFQAWQINALNDGSMSQFRVPVKPQPTNQDAFWSWDARGVDPYQCRNTTLTLLQGIMKNRARYQPGEVLFIKETWRLRGPWEYSDGERLNIHYRADDSCLRKEGWPKDTRIKDGECKGKWRSSTQMLEWSSRFRIEIAKVGAVRRQEISEKDALACGVENNGIHAVWWRDYSKGPTPTFAGYLTPVTSYRTAWDAQHAKRNAWAKNGYDWTFDFRLTD